MLKTEITEDKLVKIKFDGQVHQVDAQVFINTLVNFSEIVKELNREAGSGKSIEIKIIATEKGSFDTHLILQAVDHARQLLDAGNVALLANIVTVLGGVFTLRKWTSKKKIAEVTQTGDDNVSIRDVNGDTIVVQGNVYNIYANNQIVNDAVSNSFAGLSDDPAITGLEISDEKGVLFRAEQEEFGDMATKIIIENEDTIEQVVSANLIINKLIFEDNSRKWEFIYAGNKISASIVDKDFFASIDNGERFAKGDQLAVDLQITKVYDEALKTHLNKSYTVLEVKKHIPRDNPQQLDILDQTK